MIYYVDIDDTICITNNSDYENSVPIPERIAKINQLFEEGHTVVYWTARGRNSQKDWTNLTTEQLEKWGCKRSYIMFNKPSYDIFIDDKAINSEQYFDE